MLPVLSLLLGGLLAGCGAPSPEAPGTAESPPLITESHVERGIIVGARPLASPSASDARGATLAQLLRVASGPGLPAGPNAIEVIVRLDRAGRDVALVQQAGWRVGQRVTITPGDRPSLTSASGG